MAMNRPIESEIKSKRFDMGELIYHNCWAYMRELRTHNKTKKIYDVDPYAEVYQFRGNMYGIFVENLDGGGDAWCYLIIGPQKAMLVDTGCGLGNLRGLVEELIDGRELIVVNTHPHGDHTSGNYQFDRVYILEDDYPGLMRGYGKPTLSDRIINPDGTCRMVEFDPKDIVEPREYEIVQIKDGHVFNLGEDYDIEAVELSGHAKGQAAFLDKKGRMLFCGDDIIGMRVSVMGGPGTLRDFRDKMERLSKRVDEFDGIFPGHFITDIDSTAVFSMLEALNKIVENPENYDYVEERRQGKTYCKAVWGLGFIGYSLEAI